MDLLKRQGLLNLLFNYVAIGIGFVNTALKAKTLTPEEIGLIATILSISTLVDFIINMGIPSSIWKFYSRFRADAKGKTAFIITGFGIPLVLFVVVSMVFLFCFRNMVAVHYRNALLNRYLDSIYLFFLGNMLINIFRYIFESEFKSVVGAIVYDFLWRVMNLAILSVMLFHPIPFHYYYLYTVAAVYVRVVVFAFLLFRKVELDVPDFKQLDRSFWRELSKYSLFMFSAGMAGTITTTIDKLMIGYYINLDRVGIYTVAATFALLVKTAGSGFGHIAKPLVADAWHRNDMSGIHKIYSENANLQLFIGSFLFLMLWLLAAPIMRFLGRDYASGRGVLVLVSAGELINLATGLCGTIIAFSPKYSFDFYLRIVLAALTVFTNVIFIPLWGLTGAALATALTLALYNIIKLAFVSRYFRMLPYNRETLKIVSLVALSSLVYYAILKLILPVEHIVAVLLVVVLFFVGYLAAGIWLLKISFVIEIYGTFREKILRLSGWRYPEKDSKT